MKKLALMLVLFASWFRLGAQGVGPVYSYGNGTIYGLPNFLGANGISGNVGGTFTNATLVLPEIINTVTTAPSGPASILRLAPTNGSLIVEGGNGITTQVGVSLAGGAGTQEQIAFSDGAAGYWTLGISNATYGNANWFLYNQAFGAKQIEATTSGNINLTPLGAGFTTLGNNTVAGGNLTVSGALTFPGGAAGTLLISNGSGEVWGNVTAGNVTGLTAGGNVTLTTNTATGAVTISANTALRPNGVTAGVSGNPAALIIPGSLTLNGNGTVTNWGNTTLVSANSNLTITGNNTTITFNATDSSLNPDNLSVTSNMTAGHYLGGGSSPSIAAGSGAGSSPAFGFITTNTTTSDSAFQVWISPSATPATSSTVLSVAFAVPYATIPHVSVTPIGPGNFLLYGTSAVSYSANTTNFTITSGGVALSNSGTYTWDVLVHQ